MLELTGSQGFLSGAIRADFLGEGPKRLGEFWVKGTAWARVQIGKRVKSVWETVFEARMQGVLGSRRQTGLGK